MTFADSPYLRKGAAIGVLVIVLAGIWSILLNPYFDAFFTAREDAERTATLIDRYQSMLRSKDAIAQDLEQAKRNGLSRRYTLAAPTPALAAAQLQNTVKTIIASQGGRFSSAQTLPHENAGTGPFPAIKIRVVFAGTTVQLEEILYRLETATPFMFIERLDLQSTQNGWLNIHLEASAYLGEQPK